MIRNLALAFYFAALCYAPACAVTIDWATVGNPGNAPDTRYDANGYGGVDYSFNISRYEVTAGQYSEFLNSVAGVDDYGLYDTMMWANINGCKIERYAGTGTSAEPYQYRVASDWANRPVNFVSWGDAARFANWLHNGQPTGAQSLTTTEDGAYFLNGATSATALLAVSRELDWTWAITSEDEWYKAAYHKNDGVTGNYFNFPAGTDSIPGNSLASPDPGNNGNFYQSGYTIGSPYWRTEVGEFENSESPYGTFDQGGNVWEVMDTKMAVGGSEYYVLRGGAFFNYQNRMSSSERYPDDPATYHPDFGLASHGFRVVHIPEPATMSLISAGAVAIVLRRRM